MNLHRIARSLLSRLPMAGGSVLDLWRFIRGPTSEYRIFRRWQHLLDLREKTGKTNRRAVVMMALRGVIHNGIPGAVIEFGTYRGDTAALLLETLGPSDEIYLLDSFSGMPASDAPEDRAWSPGALTAELDLVLNRFAAFPNVRIIPGFFKDTLASLTVPSVRFAHVDADLYVSTKTVNAWLLPRISRGGVIVYDDYGFPDRTGVLKAVDEDIADGFWTLSLPTGQFIAIRS